MRPGSPFISARFLGGVGLLRLQASLAGQSSNELEWGSHLPQVEMLQRMSPPPTAATHSDVVGVDVVSILLALCPAKTDAALGV